MCRGPRIEALQARDAELDTTPIDPAQHLQVITVKPDEAVGDTLLMPKPKQTFRIFAKNPNGLSVGDGGNFPMLLDDLHDAQVGIGNQAGFNSSISAE